MNSVKILVMLFLCLALAKCSIKSQDKENKEEILMDELNRLSKFVETMESVEEGMFYGEDYIGQWTAGMNLEDSLEPKTSKFLKRKSDFVSKDAVLFEDVKCVLNENLKVFTIFAVNNHNFGPATVKVYLFSLSNRSELIDELIIAEYIDDTESPTKTGTLDCIKKEIILGENEKVFQITDSGKFIEKK